MLDKGVVTVTAALPGAQGDTARLECTPASSYYTLANTTKTRTPSAGRFRVSRNWLENGNELAVSGNVDREAYRYGEYLLFAGFLYAHLPGAFTGKRHSLPAGLFFPRVSKRQCFSANGVL